MAEAWSRIEVEATVAAYFAMLDAEIRGLGYSKAAHRRRLQTLLEGRSEGAIEYKHQNISAVLIELGSFYIPGYKPARNYQALLFEVVADRLAADRDLQARAVELADMPADVPEVEDILAAMVDAPSREERRYGPRRTRDLTPTPAGVDFLAREARNRDLGAAGEEFVLRFEVARLCRLGDERLASRVEHVSKTRGDGAGFDILSFETSGRERLIEVKTTASGSLTPFFATRNEVEVSRREADRFHLYRAYEFRRKPRLFSVAGSLTESFDLDPVQYLARIA